MISAKSKNFAEHYKTRNDSMAHAYLSGHYTLAQVDEYFGVSYVTVTFMKAWSSPRQMKVLWWGGEGTVTRPTGRREYVPVGSTAAFPAADACQSSNRTLSGTGICSVERRISKN